MKYLDEFFCKELAELTRFMIQVDGSTEKTKEAEEVIHVLLAMLDRKNQLTSVEKDFPMWVEVLISAAYLHNLYYDGTLASLFKVREIVMPLGKTYGVPSNTMAAVCKTVESQLGDKMPVESCIPSDSTPNGLFAWAVWFATEYNKEKKLPNCMPYNL